MAKVNIPTLKLNSGLDIPALGYGTWVGVNENQELLHDDIPKLVEAMGYAIDIGYRHIDTAHVYRVETQVGQVVRQKIQDGVVKREDMFITTKVWNHAHRPADVEESVKGSLQRLGLDYVDCILMHWPLSISVDGADEKIDYVDSWRGFESVLKQGLVKNIGVSNFNIDQLKRLLASPIKVPPAINQVEINVNLGQRELVEFCQKQNILVVAYTPFGSLYRDPPAGAASRHDDPALTALAAKYRKTVPQVALRYLYQRGLVSIPKSITKARILDNASIFDFELDDQDEKILKKLEDYNYRTVRPIFWQNFENYPFDKIAVGTDGSSGYFGNVPKIPPIFLSP